ncbi:MAG: hypothetical protein RLZZ301_412 [Bacteroidota bacterium]|jgi:putative membrane protein
MLLEETRAFFVQLSFFQLLLSFVLVLLNRKNWSVKFFAFLALSFLLGMASEWLGVHTGLLFGAYHYGSVLGKTLYGVPLIIGVNWSLLSIISAGLIAGLKLTKWLEISVATALMVFLDFLMEPVATQLGFWSWKGGHIPLFNYISWGLVAFLMQLLLKTWHLNESNKVAQGLFIWLILFFSILNLAL